jgi:hypothetical protein
MTRRLDGPLFAEDDSWADRSYGLVLVCPECGDTYSHVRRVGTLLGSDAVEARVYPGSATIGTTALRRSALAIELDGECGHSWRLLVQQHKGENFLGAQALEPLNESAEALH